MDVMGIPKERRLEIRTDHADEIRALADKDGYGRGAFSQWAAARLLGTPLARKASDRDMITISEAAAQFGVSRQTLYNWAAAGRIVTEMQPGTQGMLVSATSVQEVINDG